MNTDTSYQGVQFTVEQQAILNGDTDAINRLIAERNALDATFSGINGSIAVANDNLSSCWTNLGPGPAQNNCVTNWQREKDNYIARQYNITNYDIPAKDAQIRTAKQQYNDDLTRVQDAIKLGIQTSIANSTAGAQNAANTVAIQQNNPQLLADQLTLQATLDKQKRDQQVKVIGFIALTVVVVLIGWYIIKKLL